MTRTEMRLAAGISTSTLAKLNRGEEVNAGVKDVKIGIRAYARQGN
jgi:hypothetical protein